VWQGTAETLKREKFVLDWRNTGEMRAAVMVTVMDKLSELPEVFTPDIYNQKCQTVYQHVFENYYGEGRSVYAAGLDSQSRKERGKSSGNGIREHHVMSSFWGYHVAQYIQCSQEQMASINYEIPSSRYRGNLAAKSFYPFNKPVIAVMRVVPFPSSGMRTGSTLLQLL
jgi:hypothetical protein